MRIMKQTTPPLRKASVAGPQLANVGTANNAQIGTVTNIKPINNSSHLFIDVGLNKDLNTFLLQLFFYMRSYFKNIKIKLIFNSKLDYLVCNLNYFFLEKSIVIKI